MKDSSMRGYEKAKIKRKTKIEFYTVTYHPNAFWYTLSYINENQIVSNNDACIEQSPVTSNIKVSIRSL